MTSLAGRVTPEAKAAVWQALAQPCGGLHALARVTGLDWLLVAEIVAQARDKGLVEIDDRDRQAIRITRREVAA